MTPAELRAIPDPVAREHAALKAVEEARAWMGERAAVRAQAVQELKRGRTWEEVGKLLNPQVGPATAYDIAYPRKHKASPRRNGGQ